MMNRRGVLKSALSCGVLASGFPHISPLLAAVAQTSAKSSVIDPRRFGARGDGKTKDTTALQRAIDDCSRAGGGTVAVSPGSYLIGTIVLRSNVNLHLERGATLLASTDMADYSLPEEARLALKGLLRRYLVFAYQEQNISITGPGIIDGQCSRFVVRNGRPEPSPQDLWKEVAGWNWRLTNYISPMVELAGCTNVLVEDVTLQNAAGWTFRPVACKSVVIRGIRIRNAVSVPNSDGIDPACCEDVLITDCDIVTGDDAICVKSFNPYGESTPSRNVTVTNCKLSTGCNGFKVGVEGPSGFENIKFTNSTIFNGDVRLNERAIAGIAIEMTDNGWIDGISVSRITMTNVRTPIFLRLQGSYKDKIAAMSGRLKNVTISDVQATGAILSSSVTGTPGFPVDHIRLSNIRISTNEAGKIEWANNSVPELEHGYPEARMFGRLPSFGLYCRHVSDIQLQNVRIDSETQDPRPLLAADDMRGMSIVGIEGTTMPNAADGFLNLKNVSDVEIRGNTAPENTSVYAMISGPNCKDIVLTANDLRRARKPVQLVDDVPKGAVRLDTKVQRPG
jgi:polygalacturonase